MNIQQVRCILLAIMTDKIDTSAEQIHDEPQTVTLHKAAVSALLIFAALLGFTLLTSLFDYQSVAKFWPVLIVVVGFVLINDKSKKTAAVGSIVMLAGVLMLAAKFNVFGGNGGGVIEIFTLVIIALLVLFVALVILYWKCWVSYTINKTVRRMPLLVSALLITFFIWIAENIGTFTKAWLYPNQTFSWDMVRIGMLGSWLLLMVISIIMVDLLHYIRSRKSSHIHTATDY